MNITCNGPDAIYSLHRKGFSNDFHLFGNDLLWVQENISIRAGEYAILESYKASGSKYGKSIINVFGIIALYHNVKGILITHNNEEMHDEIKRALE